MIQPGKFEIRWVDRGHPPQQPPNPHYPDGCHIDLTSRAQRAGLVKRTTPSPDIEAERSCVAALPYPTGHENVGTWAIRCLTCGLVTMVTAASRPDDPRSVRVDCKVMQ